MSPQIIKRSFLFTTLLLLSSCGVKGDPLPPEEMPKLGRGHPTYQRASEKITPKATKSSEGKDSVKEEKK